MPTLLPMRRTDGITVQTTGPETLSPETLVYDERTHHAFCLNPLGSAVWQLANGCRTPAELALAATLTLGRPVTEAEVLLSLADLRAHALLQPEPASAAVPHPSRREILTRLGITAAMALPVVAAIVAPTAAQAYSGCVDCSNASGQSAAEIRTRQHKKYAAQQEEQQQEMGIVPPMH